MTKATQLFRNRIVLVFDFDGTLAPSTYPHLLNELGIDADRFVAEEVEPLEESGWEHPLAEGFALVEEIKSQGLTVTEETLAEIGRKFPLYNGVEEMFDRVRTAAHAIDDDTEVEFYMLTAGFAEVPQSSAIAHQFKTIYGGAYAFDGGTGQIRAVKRIITYPEKMRYLLQIAKGLTIRRANPRDVYRDQPQEEWYVPIDQMIYVGDGKSDMPAFRFMKDEGGIAIGVYESESAEEWEGQSAMHRDRQVQNLASNDYGEGSELLRSLILATESIAKKIALRKLSQGE